MPSQFTDFLQTYMGLQQIMNQTEQVAQRAREGAMQGANVFMELARQTANPADQAMLVDRFSQLGVGSKDQLFGMLRNVVPTAQAQKDYDIWAGRSAQDSGGQSPTATAEGRRRQEEAANMNATGQNSGQLGQAGFINSMLQQTGAPSALQAGSFADRLASGMSSGAMAVDQAQARLPAAELTQAAGVQAGTRLSAGQDASNQAQWAGIRQNDRQLAASSAQAFAELNARSQIQLKELDLQAAKARAAATGVDPKMVDNLIGAKNSLMSTLKDAKTKNPSRQELMAFIGGLNAINAQMQALGLPNEGQIDYNPEMLVQPGIWQTLKQRIYKQPTSKPQGK